ncbi:uncharacterized protein LOC112466380 [Temnothorax curvispinosus]|uniref:Uncharacterized protein LOC112466380 n=1 Tax=Temnothorax curvispinosus TaxID=300111 RepID=A0A6J1RBC6_9HYME|nr:uncharacterized protein LOC112466380 [Temnothorax curvispinosus]
MGPVCDGEECHHYFITSAKSGDQSINEDTDIGPRSDTSSACRVQETEGTPERENQQRRNQSTYCLQGRSSFDSSNQGRSSKKSPIILSVYYQNVRGMNSKLNTFLTSPDILSYDIVAITESWLSSSVHSHEAFDSQCFFVYRNDRVDRIGGGVLLAIRSNLKSMLFPLLNYPAELSDINIICVKVESLHKPFYIILFYISPNNKLTVYQTLYDYIMSLRKLWNKRILVLGDFNIPSFINFSVLNPLHAATSAFLHFYNLTQYSQIVNIIKINC